MDTKFIKRYNSKEQFFQIGHLSLVAMEMTVKIRFILVYLNEFHVGFHVADTKNCQGLRYFSSILAYVPKVYFELIICYPKTKICYFIVLYCKTNLGNFYLRYVFIFAYKA